MISQLKLATASDVDSITLLLSDMQDEVQEVEINQDITRKSILNSLNEHVNWFVFEDENGKIFGTCYLQSVHNYWQIEKRYYLGGFYIAPSHRKQGRFKDLNHQLKNWVTQHNGVQICCHIHEDNVHSLNTFSSVDVLPTEYRLCVNHWD